MLERPAPLGLHDAATGDGKSQELSVGRVLLQASHQVFVTDDLIPVCVKTHQDQRSPTSSQRRTSAMASSC
jgi:hypothetical protein